MFTLLYKNNFNKNSEPQILYFEIGFSVNIHARCLKLIMENSQGDDKDFEYIKGAMLKFGLQWVKNKNTKAQRKTSGSYKKREYTIPVSVL